jgi:hypothetical protein
VAKGEKDCDSWHIDDGVLYKAFMNTFNTVGENIDYFMGKGKNRTG